MATAAAQSAHSYRAEAALVAQQATSELAALWDDLVTPGDLFETLTDLIDDYGLQVASLAADWYDDLRDDLRIGGTFSAEPAALLDPGSVQSLVDWSQRAEADATPLDRAAAGAERRVLNLGRETVTTSAARDPQAKGWQRIGAGECGFCAMLISRGAVYTAAGAAFGAHDNCKCSAVPAWGGQPVPVRPYEPTSKNITDADRARVRAWIAANT